MSQLERFRALTLVTLLTLILVGLFAYRSHAGALSEPSVRDSLELCAASKGALCDNLGPDKKLARASEIAALGHIVVTASRITEDAVELNQPQVAFLGSITVTAPRA